jgi:hypothetical protein
MQARIRLAGGRPQKRAFVAGFILPASATSKRLDRVEHYGSRHYFGGYIRIDAVAEVDAEIRRLMRLAYRIGCQDHLRG